MIGFVWVAPKKDPFGGSEPLIIFYFSPTVVLLLLRFTMSDTDRARPNSSSLADDLERRLDIDDYSFLRPPSVVSSLVQSSARGGGGAGRGEFPGAAPVALTPNFLGGGLAGGARQVHSAPGKLPPSVFPVVYITPSTASTLCLGLIGAGKGRAGTQPRFCVARKLRGENHCGTGSHGNVRAKMSITEATFWRPGGTILDKATAKTATPIKESEMTEAEIVYIRSLAGPVARWGEYFELIREGMDKRMGAGKRKPALVQSSVVVEDVNEPSGDEEENNSVDSGLADMLLAYKRESGNYGDGTGAPVVWGKDEDSDEEDDKDDDLRKSVDKLRMMVERQAETIDMLSARLDAEKDLSAVEALRVDTNDMQDNLGDLFWLVRQHGSVSEALRNMATKQDHTEAEMASVASDLLALSQGTSQFSSKIRMSENKVATLISKLSDRTDKHLKAVMHRVEAVEAGGVMPPTLHLPPHATTGAGSSSMGGSPTMSTVFGVELVGSASVDVTMNYVFSTLRSMSQTVGKLATRYQNSGVVYGGHSFPSVEEFSKWYMSHNPSGAGVAAFVDFVSIWAFVNVSTETSAEWLASVEKSAKLGLGSQDTAYVHTMSHKYPPRIAGKGVSVVLSTECIKMLKLFEEWRGTSEGMSMGDGIRERILSDVDGAVANHRQYCLDMMPESALWDLAIQTGEDTSTFYHHLFNYIDQELHNLTTINIKKDHILLLLSNQLVRMCDDMHAVRSAGSSVRLDNLPGAATRLAWVSLQAMVCMGTYTKARFRDHPGVSSAYLRFLTCRVAAQADLGLRETLEALTRKLAAVDKLAKEAATKESLDRLDNKVESLRNGRQGEGGGGGGGGGGAPRT